MLPTNVGGLGLGAEEAHGLMATFVEPIAIAIIAIVTSVMVGGIGFLISYRSTRTRVSEVESEKVEEDIT
jgi:hypothetical protein